MSVIHTDRFLRTEEVAAHVNSLAGYCYSKMHIKNLPAVQALLTEETKVFLRALLHNGELHV